MQEREVIDLLLEKDERGMAELMRQYAPLLKYIIAPIVADAHEREDCLSEISLIIWDKIGLFDPEKGSLRAYLTAIARNAAVSHAKRLGRHTHEELPEAEPAREPGPEEQLILNERREALARALGQLTVAERSLFYRKYYYMQSTAQIASELGMTERAVEGRLYRLKKQLRKALGGDGLERT